MLDAVVNAIRGRIEDKPAFRKAIENVSLEAPRGPIRFGADHSPIQNIHLREVAKSDKGELLKRTQKTIRDEPDRARRFHCSL